VRVSPAASASSRDFLTGARVDMPTGVNAFNRDVVTGTRANVPTGVCAFSRDEAIGAQVCVDSSHPADGKSDEWVFGEFPKCDAAITSTIKAQMNGIKLSTLLYIDVDVEGQQCTGLVDSGAEICLISEELAKEIHANECGHIGVRGFLVVLYACHALE